jgi:predicted DNA-binding transcriptional regulator YafY
MLIGGYRDQQQTVSERAVWPLGLYFWGAVWTLASWCELRDNFRQFRLDRIGSLEATGRSFPDQSGRRLEDFVRSIRSQAD